MTYRIRYLRENALPSTGKLLQRHSKAAGHGLAGLPRRVALAVSADSWKDSWKDEAAGGIFELRKEYEHNVLLLSKLR
jgi:hypothetical protein